MASASARYAYLHGRVSVLAERLVSAADLEALLSCAVEEESRYLQRAGLQLPDTLSQDDPAVLEQFFISCLVQDGLVLSHALTGTARDLVSYWIRRFELANLKAILRGRLAEQPPEIMRAQLIDIGPFATLPVESLLRTDDVAEMLRLLEATPYADIARAARRVFEEQQQSFALDAAVDRRYFAGLTRKAKTVGAGEGEALRLLIGGIIDRFNLAWLLRYRFAYGLAAADAYYLLIPGGYRLDSGALRALAQLSSVEEVLAAVRGAVQRALGDAVTVTDVDRALERETWRLALQVLRRTAFNIARPFAYLALRERDIENVHAVLKGKRLGMSSDRIREALGARSGSLAEGMLSGAA